MITPEMLARSGTEHGEQCALFCWAGLPEVRKKFPVLEWMYAIPNSGARGNKVAAGQLKAEGVKAGVADVCLPVPQFDHNAEFDNQIKFAGLYIELKCADGVPSQFSKEQIDFAKFVTLQSYAWYPAFGWRDAVRIIESYLLEVKPFLTEKQQSVLNRIHA